MRAARGFAGVLERLGVLVFALLVVAVIIGASLALGYLVGKVLL